MQTKITAALSSLGSTNSNKITKDNDIPVGNDFFIVGESFIDELWIVLKLSLPICIVALAEFIPLVFINSVLANTPNAAENISIVSLARTFSNISATLILYGIMSNLYTVVPQLIGANRTDLIRVHVQRTFLLTFIISLPLMLLQFNAGRILYLMGQPPEILSQVTTYSIYLIPNVYGRVCLAITMRIAQAFNYNRILLYIMLLTACLIYPMNILCIYTFNWGYMGTAFVLDLAAVFAFISIAGYISYKGYSSIFYPFMCCSITGVKQLLDMQSLKDFFALSLPGLILQTFAFLVSQIGIILSGYVMDADLAISATMIMSVLNGICIMFCWGSFMAISIRVGKYIGAQSKEYALRSIYAGLLISCAISTVIAITLVVFRYSVSNMFTDDAEVSAQLSQLIGVLAVLQFFMNIYYSLIAVFRALGLQRNAAIIVIVCYYLFSLPLTLVLLFSPMTRFSSSTYSGTMTLWSLLAFGNLLSGACLMVYLVFRVKLDMVVNDVQMRIMRTSVLVGNNSMYEELVLKNMEVKNYYGSVYTAINGGKI